MALARSKWLRRRDAERGVGDSGCMLVLVLAATACVSVAMTGPPLGVCAGPPLEPGPGELSSTSSARLASSTQAPTPSTNDRRVQPHHIPTARSSRRVRSPLAPPEADERDGTRELRLPTPPPPCSEPNMEEQLRLL